MNESPEIRVETLREANDTAPGSKLAYVAALFKGTLLAWPAARLRVSGGNYVGDVVTRTLVMLGVPPTKIDLLTIDASRVAANLPPVFNPTPSQNPLVHTLNGVGVTILYRPAPKRTVSMQFKPDSGEPPVEVQFEVSPDGREIEVGAQVSVLKGYIKKYAGASSADPTGRDRVRTIKIATKVIGLAQFDVGTQNQVATTLKAKVKEAISLEVVKGLTVEFYGAGFAKYDMETNKARLGTEFGAGITITWD